MPIHALWPRTRRERTLAARCLRLADALRTTTAERDRLRERLTVERDILLWLHGEQAWRLSTWTQATVTYLGCDCTATHQEMARMRCLLRSQADHLAAARAEVDALHADIARIRPVLMPKEKA